MTQQEARSELKQIHIYSNRISERNQRLAELRASITGVRTIRYGNLPTAANAQNKYKLESAIDRAAKLETQLTDDVIAMAEAQQKIVKKIERLPEPYASVLIKRYVHLQRFEKIASDMNYTREWVRHLDSAGVRKYTEL
ncbi:MAG: hypothetical protein NC132_05515 [Corallococcus sp.]|nr:hypothetical protein [Corallococcus sp.]